jgi:hypothetical protein
MEKFEFEWLPPLELPFLADISSLLALPSSSDYNYAPSNYQLHCMKSSVPEQFEVEETEEVIEQGYVFPWYNKNFDILFPTPEDRSPVSDLDTDKYLNYDDFTDQSVDSQQYYSEVDEILSSPITQTVKHHRLLPAIMNLIMASKEKNEQSTRIPSLFTPDTKLFIEEERKINYSLGLFLNNQAINVTPGTEFFRKYQSLNSWYESRRIELDEMEQNFSDKLVKLLKVQSTIRPITCKEVEDRLHSIHERFEFLKCQLKFNTCNQIMKLAEDYQATTHKAKTLPPASKAILSSWFFQHLTVSEIFFHLK